MGPFELMDLTGLDVSGRVMESIYEQFHQEPRFRPSSWVRPRIAAGLFGRKSGQGWYAYDGEHKVERQLERQVDAPVRPLPALHHDLRIWIDAAAPDHAAIEALVSSAGGALCADAAEAGLIIVQFWGRDASGYCAAQGLDAARCVAVDPLPGLNRHRTLMLTAVTTPAVRDAADIAPRGIASTADIDAAVTLGLGYPLGPLAWGDAIGAARVLEILHALHATTGEPRYRASPWLRRHAQRRFHGMDRPRTAVHPNLESVPGARAGCPVGS
jgi:3-hydroxybutyryl-CoA dehydrogenase